MSALRTREESIHLSLQIAEDARMGSERALKESKKSPAKMEEAVEKMDSEAAAVAHMLRADSVLLANAEASRILEKASDSIKALEHRAVGEIHVTTSQLVVEAAGTILANIIDESQQRKLVHTALENLSKVYSGI